MRKYLLPAGALLITLWGCEPSSRLYLTPPVYFGTAHSLPMADSLRKLVLSSSVILPTAAEIKFQYKINKNFLFNLSYFGNIGAYSNFSNNDIDYRYTTNLFDFQAGYIIDQKNNKARLFVLAGYGEGKTTSVVPENGSPINFIYKGKFSRFTLTPGVHLIQAQKYRLSFTWRQSFVKFGSYQLPEISYQNRQQFLTDMMLNCYVSSKKIGVNLFFGSFLNGLQGGNRQLDQKPEIWRIERFFAGINLGYKFSFYKTDMK